MDTRKYTDRYAAKRLLRSPVYRDVHERHVAKVNKMEAALRSRNAQIVELRADLDKANAEIKSTKERLDAAILAAAKKAS